MKLSSLRGIYRLVWRHGGTGTDNMRPKGTSPPWFVNGSSGCHGMQISFCLFYSCCRMRRNRRRLSIRNWLCRKLRKWRRSAPYRPLTFPSQRKSSSLTNISFSTMSSHFVFHIYVYLCVCLFFILFGSQYVAAKLFSLCSWSCTHVYYLVVVIFKWHVCLIQLACVEFKQLKTF